MLFVVRVALWLQAAGFLFIFCPDRCLFVVFGLIDPVWHSDQLCKMYTALP